MVRRRGDGGSTVSEPGSAAGAIRPRFGHDRFPNVPPPRLVAAIGRVDPVRRNHVRQRRDFAAAFDLFVPALDSFV
jgi:hypothetical protein